MDTVIVYLDDPAYAGARIAAVGGPPTHWVLVACAPRMTHRASKWLSHSARENWRRKWAHRLFQAVVPPLQAHGDTVTPVLARLPLPKLTRALQAEYGPARVLDVRRPRGGEGIAPHQPGAVLGLAAMLLLAAE